MWGHGGIISKHTGVNEVDLTDTAVTINDNECNAIYMDSTRYIA